MPKIEVDTPLPTLAEVLDLILDRLDEIEEKIDNLNLSANAGYSEVDDL
jgi:tetrahydromethanopterin S-methyltransferase subunit G